MNEQNYTSLKLSKLLAKNGCELESEREWDVTMGGEYVFARSGGLKQSYVRLRSVYPAYDILNDLCVKYAKEMFGEGEIQYDTAYHSEMDLYTPAYKLHPHTIFSLRQQGKKQEAEDYLFEHCLFNPKNK